MYVALREHGKAAAHSGAVLSLALERNGGAVSRYSLPIFHEQHSRHGESRRLAERVLKLLLWQRGGYKVSVAGSRSIAALFADRYRAGGERGLDAECFARVYERPAFVVEAVEVSALPPENEQGKSVGGHLNGCRIGFDAGGSDRKVAAVIDGETVF